LILVVEGVGFEPTKDKSGRFTACSHWPLGQPSENFEHLSCAEKWFSDEERFFIEESELERGLEPLTFCLQNRCSTD
jgi:hypothetical protein